MSNLLKVNPDFLPFEKDTYILESEGKEGNYYHRFVDGDRDNQASEYAYFSHSDLKEGILI
jgi:hypothetical protein